MFRLEKTFCFEASHQLLNHDGKCQRLHGHSWTGALIVEGSDLIQSGPKGGMLIDFVDLSAVIKPLVETCLDHWHLNDSTGLENPTSEELARWIYNKVSPLLPLLVAVRIEETCTSACEYRP